MKLEEAGADAVDNDDAVMAVILGKVEEWLYIRLRANAHPVAKRDGYGVSAEEITVRAGKDGYSGLTPIVPQLEMLFDPLDIFRVSLACFLEQAPHLKLDRLRWIGGGIGVEIEADNRCVSGLKGQQFVKIFLRKHVTSSCRSRDWAAATPLLWALAKGHREGHLLP